MENNTAFPAIFFSVKKDQLSYVPVVIFSILLATMLLSIGKLTFSRFIDEGATHNKRSF